MLDLTSVRDELARHYDLAPSLELAESMKDIHARMDRVMPWPDWAIHAPYVAAINRLKRERNAVVLAHNYMTPQIYHGISDVVGDSLHLAIKATEVQADVIVQCGVHFMAETSKILNPAKTVLMPDMEAGCSLAESITAAGIAVMRARFPGAPVVSYVNTTAEVKANFTGTLREGEAICTATLLHGGRTTQVWDAKVEDAATGKLMAAFRCTQIILYPRA